MVINREEKTIKCIKECIQCHKSFEDIMTSFNGLFPLPPRIFKTEQHMCPECNVKWKKHFEKIYSAAFFNMDENDVKKYFIDNPPFVGQELLLLDTSGRHFGPSCLYTLIHVEEPSSGRQKRIIIKENAGNGYSGKSFYRSGINCYSPKGQVCLRPYNEVIGVIVKENKNKSVMLSYEKVYKLLYSEEKCQF